MYSLLTLLDVAVPDIADEMHMSLALILIIAGIVLVAIGAIVLATVAIIVIVKQTGKKPAEPEKTDR